MSEKKEFTGRETYSAEKAGDGIRWKRRMGSLTRRKWRQCWSVWMSWNRCRKREGRSRFFGAQRSFKAVLPKICRGKCGKLSKKRGGCGNPVSFVLTTYRRYVKLRKVKKWGNIPDFEKKYKTENGTFVRNILKFCTQDNSQDT